MDLLEATNPFLHQIRPNVIPLTRYDRSFASALKEGNINTKSIVNNNTKQLQSKPNICVKKIFQQKITVVTSVISDLSLTNFYDQKWYSIFLI